MLAGADLVTLHEHLHRLSMETDTKCAKALSKIRQNEKRWAPGYECEVENSIKLCTMKVKSCEQVDDFVYTVTDDDGMTSTVNLDTKVVHLGNVYIVPTCTCGYWMSTLRMCKCIIKALREAQRDVWIVTNIHPYHLVQLHPMWPDALKLAMRRDYSDFPHLSIESRLGECCFSVSLYFSNTS